MINPPASMWCGTTWMGGTTQDVPKASVHAPVELDSMSFASQTASGNDVGVAIWDWLLEQEQPQDPLYDLPSATSVALDTQDYTSYAVASPSSCDPVDPSSTSFQPHTTHLLSSLEPHPNQVPWAIPRRGSYQEYYDAVSRRLEPTGATPMTAVVDDHGYSSSYVLGSGDAIFGKYHHLNLSDIKSIPFTNASLGSVDSDGPTGGAFIPCSPVASTSAYPAGPSTASASSSGSERTLVEYHGSCGYGAPKAYDSPWTDWKTASAWSRSNLDSPSPFTTSPTSSAASVPPSRPLAYRFGKGSMLEEIMQHEYGKPNPRRISYGPNGLSLQAALLGTESGSLSRMAFPSVEMNQKMSIRYQFVGYKKYSRQVNVLCCARSKERQPACGRLAALAAKEMRTFMQKNKDFEYGWDQLVLLHIDLVAKGSLQPRIGVLSQ